jgi:arylformamidase
MRIWDISEPIDERTAPFPGDTPFSREWVMRIADGMSCNVSTIRHTTHLGTHADAPLHYDDAGAGIGEVPLDAYIGRCRVLTVTTIVGEAGTPVVDPACLRAAGIGTGGGGDAGTRVERLLLHTLPDGKHDRTRFEPAFPALGPEAARLVVAAGVRLIGIDTPSMDPSSAKVLNTHHVLRDAGVALLENLDLTGVPDGDDYELIALPLRIVGGDSSPVRAILRR